MFEIGQQVVCINAKNSNSWLTEGKLYTVSEIGVSPPLFGSILFISVAEAKWPGFQLWVGDWRAERFRPKTDISELRRLVEDLPIARELEPA